MTTARHKAGRATYRGDVRSIVGELKGPTTFGSVLIATGADYDATADTPRVEFSYATADDFAAVTG